MNKILFSILAICLVAIMASSVSAVCTVWNPLSAQNVDEDSADATIVYADLTSLCSGGDPADFSVISIHTHYTLVFSGSDLVTSGVMDLNYNSDIDGSETVTIEYDDGINPIITEDFELTVTAVNDDPTILGTIPDQTKVEDSAAWTLDLSGYERDIEDYPIGTSGSSKLTWSVNVADTTLFNVVVTDSLNDIVTFTPVADAIGSDLITFTLTDSNGGTVTQDVVVTLTSAGNDDAPTVTAIPDQKWTKGEVHTLDLKNYFTDPDDVGTLTYGWEATADLSTDLTLTEANGVVIFTPVSSGWKGSHYVNFTLLDGVHDIVTSNKVKLVVRNEPDFVCEENEVGDLSIDSISDPDDGDNFKPGEKIKIKLNVDNNYDEDLDVVVEAFLYDETDDKVIESVESESQEIKDGKDEKFEFDLLISLDEDLDEDHTYQILLKVYEDGNEDDHCVESSAIDINIERDNHDVIMTKLDVTPTLVSPGETVEFEVKVENIGATDEDDVTVKIVETDLGLNLVSSVFDLDDYEGDDNTQTVRFAFTVPSNANAGTYSINAGVYDEDDDIFDQSDDSEMFVSFVVSGSAFVSTDEVEVKVSDIPSSVDAGKSYSIPVKVTNNKNVQDTFTVKLTNIDDWATSSSEKVLTLKAGQSETVYMYFKANEEIGEGKYSATVEIKDSLGSIVGSETVTIGAEDGIGWSSWFSGSKIFWIIGDIILIIVAIFFIKLIFGRGKGKIKEVRL